MKILRNVQALRAIAALLVVCVHLGNPQGFEARYLHANPPLLAGVAKIGFTGVDLFFVISGFIMTLTTLGPAKPPSSAEFFIRRIIRIYPPLWIITAPLLVVYLTHPGLMNSHSAFPPDIAASFLALPQRGSALLLVSWSLVYEMYFYFVFALALGLGRFSFPWVMAIWALGTAALNATFGSSANPWMQLISNPLCFEFLLGVAVGWLVLAGRYGSATLWLSLGAVGYAVGAELGSGEGWSRVLASVPLALILFGAIGLEKRSGIVLPRFLDKLGDASYATYLWHIPVLAVFGLFVARMPFGPASRVQDTIIVAFGIALVEIAALCVYRYVERPLTRALTDTVMKGVTPRYRRSGQAVSLARSGAPDIAPES
jgi:peptidoglycan/LPS O-acetylase OafA/YrhL